MYTNSLLFIDSGGNSRLAGIMLAGATTGIMLIGPVIVGFIPVMVVGALIFLLGIELMEEALVDTWGKLHRHEYLTVSLILLAYKLQADVLGRYNCRDDGCLGFRDWHPGGNHPGLPELCRSNFTKICHPRYLLRQNCRFYGSAAADSTPIPKRSWAADFDPQAWWLSILRNHRGCREYHARTD